MWLLPWLTERYTSPLSPAELLRWLQRNTAEVLGWQAIFEARPVAAWLGTIGAAGFKLRRNGWGRNSTYLVGQVAPGPNGAGSVLRLQYRPHWLVLAFEPLRIVFLVGCLAFLTASALSSPETRFGAAVVGSGFMFIIALPLLLFRWEVRKSRALLRQMLPLTATTT